MVNCRTPIGADTRDLLPVSNLRLEGHVRLSARHQSRLQPRPRTSFHWRNPITLGVLAPNIPRVSRQGQDVPLRTRQSSNAQRRLKRT
jgi:hypothetical protein